MPLLPCKRAELSRISYLILFSLYISIFLNIAYYRQVLADMPLDNLHGVLVFLSMPVVAFSVINIIATLASFLWLDRLVLALFILVSASAQYFIINYGIVLDRSMIVNMMDTTASETFALLTPKMVITLLLTALLMMVMAFWVRIKKTLPRWKSALYRLISVAISVCLILLVALFFYKDYASLFRNNKELVKALSPSNSIVASLSYYSHQKLANAPLIKIGEDAKLSPLIRRR